MLNLGFCCRWSTASQGAWEWSCCGGRVVPGRWGRWEGWQRGEGRGGGLRQLTGGQVHGCGKGEGVCSRGPAYGPWYGRLWLQEASGKCSRVPLPLLSHQEDSVRECFFSSPLNSPQPFYASRSSPPGEVPVWSVHWRWVLTGLKQNEDLIINSNCTLEHSFSWAWFL